MLCHETENSDQGLGVFFQFGWSPEDRNTIDGYLGGGLSYVGLLPGHDEDITGLGLAQASWSDRIAESSREAAIELFYQVQLTESQLIKPDIQYIANPGGDGTIKDALAFGIKFGAVF